MDYDPNRGRVFVDEYEKLHVDDTFTANEGGMFKVTSPTEIERLPNRKERRRRAKLSLTNL